MSWFVPFTHKKAGLSFPLLVFLARSSTDAFKKEKNLLNAAVIGSFGIFSLCAVIV